MKQSKESWLQRWCVRTSQRDVPISVERQPPNSPDMNVLDLCFNARLQIQGDIFFWPEFGTLGPTTHVLRPCTQDKNYHLGLGLFFVFSSFSGSRFSVAVLAFGPIFGSPQPPPIVIHSFLISPPHNICHIMSASRCVSSVPHSHSHAFSGLRSSFKPSRFRVSSSRLALASPSRAAGKHDTRVSGLWHGSDKSARRHNKLSQAPRTGNLRTPTNRRTSSRYAVRTRASDSQFLTSTASCVAPIPLEAAFALWSDRRRIPKWMPWVTSVQTGFDDDRLSKWTVSTDTLPKPWDRPLGQRLEYSWYALNSEPVEGDGFRTIAWVADEAAAVAAGTDANARAALVTNKGKVVIRYESPTSCAITLSVSYAAPEALQPMGMALGPVLENILKNDLERFAVYSKKVVKVVE